MNIFYFKQGQKHSFRAENLTDAVNRKRALRKTYGNDFSGCSNFHYLEDGIRIWF
jgi:hypothetical protein